MKVFDLELDSKKLAFILIFSALGLLFYQFNFSPIVGVILEEKPYFTFFQFIGPVAGGIIGPVGGIISVVLVGLSNFLLTGQVFSVPVVVSVITMSFAALYFGTKRKAVAVVPLLCMLLFCLHPEGGQAWFYTLFWLIPIAASFYKQNIFLRSLGATFTAHAIGSVAYAYAFNIPTAAYLPLMVITPMERLLFAVGISVSYYAVNTVLSTFSSRVDFSFLNIEKKYALWRA